MSRRFPRCGVKLVYERPEASDDTMVLVDRIWPRRLTNEHASADVWLKDIAPRALASGAGLAMTRTAGASFTSDTRGASRHHLAVEHVTDLVLSGKSRRSRHTRHRAQQRHGVCDYLASHLSG
ncbi:hypothetical protein [Bradyrhizobium sp. STM 3557]|uniref:DUF488 family protein, N3 subclade n=1 Tax=Bradyrhizobium sp. STM 3557 TaxID=578920 RepID=UPI00388F46D8